MRCMGITDIDKPPWEQRGLTTIVEIAATHCRDSALSARCGMQRVLLAKGASGSYGMLNRRRDPGPILFTIRVTKFSRGRHEQIRFSSAKIVAEIGVSVNPVPELRPTSRSRSLSGRGQT